MRAIPRFPAVLICIAGLSGCGSSPETPKGAESDNVAVANTAAVNTAGPATEATPTTEPVLTANGWGPLHIGMTTAEVTAALGADDRPERAASAEPEQCDQFHPARAPKGMLVMVEQGRLTRISLIRDAMVATDKGIRLGDSAGKVEAAYGLGLLREPHAYVEMPAAYLVAWSRGGETNGKIAPDSRGIVYETDATGRVDSIHAGGPSIRYVEGCA